MAASHIGQRQFPAYQQIVGALSQTMFPRDFPSLSFLRLSFCEYDLSTILRQNAEWALVSRAYKVAWQLALRGRFSHGISHFLISNFTRARTGY